MDDYLRLQDESGEEVTTAGFARFAEAGKDGVHYSSESDEWWTPSDIIERVVQVLGVIDLDPCSNSKTKPNVPAKEHFTKEDDGLAHDWLGRVYMNPPYGRELVLWVEKLAGEFEAGKVKEALALVPSRTDTEWFKRLRAYPRAFLFGRLQFSGHDNSAPFPSMVVHLGRSESKFVSVFAEVGDIYALTRMPSS